MTVNVSDLVGLPWKFHGRGEEGLDCFGLIMIIAARCGKKLNDPLYRGFDPSLVKLAEYAGLAKAKRLQAGCVIEMEKDGRLHLGYALDMEKMIHCTCDEGVVVEDIKNFIIRGFYTWA